MLLLECWAPETELLCALAQVPPCTVRVTIQGPVWCRMWLSCKNKWQEPAGQSQSPRTEEARVKTARTSNFRWGHCQCDCQETESTRTPMLTLPGAAPLLFIPMSTTKGTHLSGSQSLVDTSWSSPKPQVRNSISLPISYIKLQISPRPTWPVPWVAGAAASLWCYSYSLTGHWPWLFCLPFFLWSCSLSVTNDLVLFSSVNTGISPSLPFSYLS